jgi:hypothetical protein
MWIGTINGLNRFDGDTFTTFQYDEQNSHSLTSSHIRDLAETSDGSVWVATSTGVNRVILATGAGKGVLSVTRATPQPAAAVFRGFRAIVPWRWMPRGACGWDAAIPSSSTTRRPTRFVA